VFKSWLLKAWLCMCTPTYFSVLLGSYTIAEQYQYDQANSHLIEIWDAPL